MSARAIGSLLGLIIGMALVIYLDKTEAFSNRRASKGSSLSASTETSSPKSDTVAELRERTVRQAEEIARLQRAKDAAEALNLLRTEPVAGDPRRPELARYREISLDELNNEIKVAVDNVASYTSLGVYAPLQHAELHRRVNELWDVKGLEPTQNDWLGDAAIRLNELVVRHAEQAVEKGNDDEVIRAALSLGPWAFRLTKEQKPRMITAVETVAGHYR